MKIILVVLILTLLSICYSSAEESSWNDYVYLNDEPNSNSEEFEDRIDYYDSDSKQFDNDYLRQYDELSVSSTTVDEDETKIVKRHSEMEFENSSIPSDGEQKINPITDDLNNISTETSSTQTEITTVSVSTTIDTTASISTSESSSGTDTDTETTTNTTTSSSITDETETTVSVTSTTIEVTSTSNTTEEDSSTVVSSEATISPTPISSQPTTISSQPTRSTITAQTATPTSGITTTRPGIINDDTKVATWAIVTICILISFAAAFTVLYFLRGCLLMRRRQDQRRLLGSTGISQEGFFFGGNQTYDRFGEL